MGSRAVERPLYFKLVGVAALGLLAAAGVAFFAFGHKAPKTAEQLKSDAVIAYKKGDFKSAVGSLEGYLKKNEGDVAARNLLVSAYGQLGNGGAALAQARKVVSVKPRDPETLLRAGQLAARAGHRDEAVAYLERAARAKPKMIQAHQALAGLYFDSKNYGGALREWQRLLALMPAQDAYRAVVYAAIGDTYKTMGKKSEAAKAYSKGIALKPGDKELARKLAEVSK